MSALNFGALRILSIGYHVGRMGIRRNGIERAKNRVTQRLFSKINLNAHILPAICALTLGLGAMLPATTATAKSLHSEALSFHETQSFFDEAFTLARTRAVDLRRWDGTEHFCFIWNDQNTPLRSFAPKTIDLIARTYSLVFTQSHTTKFSNCDQNQTSIYVFVGAYPGNAKLGTMLEDLVGKPPPKGIISSFPVLGASITLPGPRNRDFIFVATKQDNNVPDLLDSHAIFLEELLHSLLGASDVEAVSSISQLAEVQSDGNYSEWYRHNPRGWCMIDFLFLELVLGRMQAVGSGFNELRVYMSSNYSDLMTKSAQQRRQLAELSDQRC